MEAILLKISDVAASRFNSYFPLVFAVTKPTWAVTQLVVMLPHPCWFHSLFHKIPSKTIQGRYIDQAIPPTIVWWPPTRTTKQPRTGQGGGHQDWLIDRNINRLQTKKMYWSSQCCSGSHFNSENWLQQGGTLTWMVWSQHPGFIRIDQGRLPHLFYGCWINLGGFICLPWK